MCGIKCVSLVFFCNLLIMQKCNPTRNLSNSQHIPCLTWKHTMFLWRPFFKTPSDWCFEWHSIPAQRPSFRSFCPVVTCEATIPFTSSSCTLDLPPTQQQWHWDPTYTQKAMTFLFLDIFFSRNCGFLHFSLICCWKKFLRATCPYRWSFVASIQELLLKHPLHQGYDLRFEDLSHWKTMGSRRAWLDFDSWKFWCLGNKFGKRNKNVEFLVNFLFWQLEMLKRCSEFHGFYGYFPTLQSQASAAWGVPNSWRRVGSRVQNKCSPSNMLPDSTSLEHVEPERKQCYSALVTCWNKKMLHSRHERENSQWNAWFWLLLLLAKRQRKTVHFPYEDFKNQVTTSAIWISVKSCIVPSDTVPNTDLFGTKRASVNIRRQRS